MGWVGWGGGALAGDLRRAAELVHHWGLLMMQMMEMVRGNGCVRQGQGRGRGTGRAFGRAAGTEEPASSSDVPYGFNPGCACRVVKAFSCVYAHALVWVGVGRGYHSRSRPYMSCDALRMIACKATSGWHPLVWGAAGLRARALVAHASVRERGGERPLGTVGHHPSSWRGTTIMEGSAV